MHDATSNVSCDAAVVHSEVPDAVSAEPSYAEDATYLPQSRLLTDFPQNSGTSIDGSKLFPQHFSPSVASPEGNRLTANQASIGLSVFQHDAASVSSSTNNDGEGNAAATANSMHTPLPDSSAAADLEDRHPSSVQVSESPYVMLNTQYVICST